MNLIWIWYLNMSSSKQNNSSQGNECGRQTKLNNLPPQALKHLWIRTALLEKLLDKIILYLVENSRYPFAYILIYTLSHTHLRDI